MTKFNIASLMQYPHYREELEEILNKNLDSFGVSIITESGEADIRIVIDFNYNNDESFQEFVKLITSEKKDEEEYED